MQHRVTEANIQQSNTYTIATVLRDKRCLDSIIPDMAIYASDLNDEGRDLIVDMKTLSPSASYEHNKSEFAYAVRGR